MTYRIIGADQKEYGPAEAELVNDWILQRRMDGATLAIAEGAPAWKPLSAYPEFAAALAQVAPAPSPLPLRAAGQPPMDPLAVAGFVLGIVSVLCCCCGGLPFNVIGAVFSGVAMARIRQEPERYRGWELALAGLILSALSLVMWVAAQLTGLLSQSDLNDMFSDFWS